MWMGRGLGLGIPGWTAPRSPTMPPPALKAIDLRVVDEMLGNAAWVRKPESAVAMGNGNKDQFVRSVCYLVPR